MSLAKESRAILETLEDLEAENFRKFCFMLKSSEEPPHFRANDVKDKSRDEIAQLLVDRCVSGAVDRTIKTLRDIGCNHSADTLAAKFAEHPQPKRDRSKTPPPHMSSAGVSGAPATGSTAPAKQEHFIDRHRIQLIDRVSNMGPILEHLRQERVLQSELYSQVRKIPTTQEQMRFLFDGPLRSGGDKSKDVLLSVLEEEEPYLIQDLKETEG